MSRCDEKYRRYAIYTKPYFIYRLYTKNRDTPIREVKNRGSAANSDGVMP